MHKAIIITYKALIGYFNELNINFPINFEESSVVIIKITTDDVMNYNDELNTLKQIIIYLIANSYFSFENYYVITTMDIE
jgi:hypothetical protein